MTKFNPRQLALLALQKIYQQQAYTDIALDRVLRQVEIKSSDRALVAELTYGIVRRQRTLDALIDQLGTKPVTQQPPNLRIILQIGLYQLRYLTQIPASAAVNTSVELAKTNRLGKLAGVVNGLLRNYIRQAVKGDPLNLPADPVARLGILHSFPDWIVEVLLQQLNEEETNQLCAWFNQTPTLDLRINPLKTSIEEVTAAFTAVGISVTFVPHLPQALRITGKTGAIAQLPGFKEGWWMVQDSSAQLVTHLLDPQPKETIIDACAAPGGKTTHIAELMGDNGTIWASDRNGKRLQKVAENARRLGLRSLKLCPGDSRNLTQFTNKGDRVLVDAPCSGLGTLHKRPDIRFSQNPAKIEELTRLQQELLSHAATWVKPGGVLVYATCTLNPPENELAIATFLQHHPQWEIAPFPSTFPSHFQTAEGWLKIFPHRHQMDGFFMVRLQRKFA